MAQRVEVTTTAEASLINIILISLSFNLLSWWQQARAAIRSSGHEPNIQPLLLQEPLLLQRFSEFSCHHHFVASSPSQTMINFGFVISCRLFRSTWYDLELVLYPTDVTNHYSGFPITRFNCRRHLTFSSFKKTLQNSI